jgi:hypothetical protein
MDDNDRLRNQILDYLYTAGSKGSTFNACFRRSSNERARVWDELVAAGCIEPKGFGRDRCAWYRLSDETRLNYSVHTRAGVDEVKVGEAADYGLREDDAHLGWATWIAICDIVEAEHEHDHLCRAPSVSISVCWGENPPERYAVTLAPGVRVLGDLEPDFCDEFDGEVWTECTLTLRTADIRAAFLAAMRA